jgi:hypothetical protein
MIYSNLTDTCLQQDTDKILRCRNTVRSTKLIFINRRVALQERIYFTFHIVNSWFPSALASSRVSFIR